VYSNSFVFCILWLVVFILYFPASQAGRVGDFPGWVHFLNSANFIDYINRSESGIRSLYQFTQIITCLFYKAFGTNAWLWHLLYITLQVTNAFLLFVFFRRMFSDAGAKNPPLVAITGALLFCVCPHISEVVVWEPAFHFLLGFLLILITLICAQNFIGSGRLKYAWWGGAVFFLSSYSLEVFYLTPVFVVTLGMYYRSINSIDRERFLKLLKYFSLPQAAIMVAYFIVLQLIYHGGVAHLENKSLEFGVSNFSKPLKYIFHIVFFGRFFPTEIRNRVYHFCESPLALAVFYCLSAVLFLYIAIRFRRPGNKQKTLALILVWLVCSLALILLLWFPQYGLVIYDRYTYVLCGIFYMFLAFFVCNFSNKYISTTVLALYALINIRFAHKVIAYWQQSAGVVNNLVYTFPNDPSKKVLLLDLPECLDGVQMIGSRDDGEFRMMYNAIMPHQITNPVYDVEAYYLHSPADGASVTVINDSTVHVTLDQWGSWWLYYGFGAMNYENSDYKVNMKDPGHMYELILKHPCEQYLLLYETDGKWKVADWSKKNVPQY
jgi:hypothetical protein